MTVIPVPRMSCISIQDSVIQGGEDQQKGLSGDPELYVLGSCHLQIIERLSISHSIPELPTKAQ